MASASPTSTESGARARTRQAILDAAATVWARNAAAPVSDVADAAQVGRSTLHRYFSDRAELVEALTADSWAAMEAAGEDAALDQGSPGEALRRLIRGLIQVGDRLVFLFNDPRNYEAEDVEGAEDSFLDHIRRAQAEGALAPDVDARWIQSTLYALVYSAIDAVGHGYLPRHGAADTVIRTFERGLGGPADQAAAVAPGGRAG